MRRRRIIRRKLLQRIERTLGGAERVIWARLARLGERCDDDVYMRASERAVESLRGLALTVTLPVSSQHCLTWHLDNKYVFIDEPTLHRHGIFLNIYRA